MAMIWKRIPHLYLSAAIFGIIALVLAAAIVKSTVETMARQRATIAYAQGELDGIRDLRRTHTLLRRLLVLRAAVVRTPHAPELRTHLAAIGAAIEGLSDRPSTHSPLDDGIRGEVHALRAEWTRATASGIPSPEALSTTIETIQPLLNAIASASGISNDPSIDGINFGDAIIRFPLALAYGSRAGYIGAVNLAAGNAALPPRFTAAELLANAKMALDVGMQDAEDEMAVDPAAAAVFSRHADAVVRDFRAVRRLLATRYVQARRFPSRSRLDEELTGSVDTFTISSLAVIDELRADLLRVTSARIADAQIQCELLRWQTIGAVASELLMISILGWISSISYRNQRKRAAAERQMLESEHQQLEAQLTHAKAQQALLHAKAQFRAVFDRAPTGMVIVDPHCTILDINEAASTMLRNAGEAVRAETIVLDHASVIARIVSGRLETYAAEREYRGRHGRPCWLEVSISPVHDEAGTTAFAILMLRDITESKSLEAQLVYEAGHDALTDLPNRKYFLTILQQALDLRANGATRGTFSVVFIDFNDFKTINDSFGHQAGDQFLIECAHRLRDAVRASDVVARIGGDEFAILMHGATRDDIEKSVGRLQGVVSVPINIEDQLVASSASFGIAPVELSYTLAAEIIRDADTAMYTAKARGGRNYVVFDLSMREEVVRRMQLSIDIVHALEHDELQLLYQPIVDLETGRIVGCEALVRWRRADGTLVLPSEFMPLAEENGSIIEIGRWVVTTACRQIQDWNAGHRQGHLPAFAEFVMHVNLAVPEVHHADLLTNLQRTLGQTGVDRNQLVLEITEGIILKNTQRVRATLDGLTDAGFRLCIDDFGTGYSSLRYLNELPLHSFKIDKSFVSNGDEGLANASIVDMLMVLSRSLELGVVAEGIETATQWQALRALGCHQGQGYLFARPIDGATFTELLRRDAPLADPLAPPQLVA